MERPVVNERPPGIVAKSLGSMFDRVLKTMFYVASLISLVIFFSTCTELFLRYFFNLPQIWAVEVTEYAMLYMTFLGAAWLLKEDRHVKIDLLFAFIGLRSQALLNSLSAILGAIVCAVLLFYGVWSTWHHYVNGLTTFSAMEPLKWPFLIVIPFGSLLLLVQFLRNARAQWGRYRSPGATE